MLCVSLFDCLSFFLWQLYYTSIFESHYSFGIFKPFFRYQVCTNTCLSKEVELCLNNSEYITIYMQYTNKYICKLNVYRCWNICVDHCQLRTTVYKVKIGKKLGSTWRLDRSTVGRRQSYKMPTNLHDYSNPWEYPL
jgi:hypothetical protein